MPALPPSSIRRSRRRPRAVAASSDQAPLALLALLAFVGLLAGGWWYYQLREAARTAAARQAEQPATPNGGGEGLAPLQNRPEQNDVPAAGRRMNAEPAIETAPPRGGKRSVDLVADRRSARGAGDRKSQFFQAVRCAPAGDQSALGRVFRRKPRPPSRALRRASSLYFLSFRSGS
jgi:hypothetical protein